MSDRAERFVQAIGDIDAIADEVSSDEAAETFDATSLQVFWREWPHISSWAGALWRRLNDDLAQAAAAPADEDMDETGTAG